MSLPPREQGGLIAHPHGLEERTVPHRRGLLASLAAGGLALAAAPARTQPRSNGTPRMSPDVVSQLAPTGVLRAGINLGNFLLVTGRTPEGDPDGVSPDMARTIAER